MANKADKPSPQPETAAPLMVKDVHHAPIIYFEGAPNFGNNFGIINVTLAASRHLQEGEAVITDVVAVAHLRCSVAAAVDLRRALDDALLLGIPAQGEKH
jgi:hypothetical protein